MFYVYFYSNRSGNAESEKTKFPKSNKPKVIKIFDDDEAEVISISDDDLDLPKPEFPYYPFKTALPSIYL
jgi:hypothetical protein